MKKGIEVNFKCEVIFASSKEAEVEEYLKKTYSGLRVRSVSKLGDRFNIQSNILSLLSSLNEQVTNLGAENAKLKNSEKEHKEKITEFENKVKELEANVAGASKKDGTIKKLEEKSNSLQTVNKSLVKSVSAAQKTIREKDTIINELTEKNKTLDTSVAQLTTDKDGLIEDVKKLYEKLLEREKAFNAVVDKVKELEGENAELHENIKDHEEQRVKIEERKDSVLLEERVKELEELLKTTSEKKAILKAKVKKLKIDNYKQEDQLKGMKVVLNGKEAQYKELEEFNKNIENDYQLAESQIEILQMKLEENDKQFNTLKKRVEILESTNKDLELRAVQAKQNLERLNNSYELKEREKKVKESEEKVNLEKLENKIKSMTLKLAMTEEILAATKPEVNNSHECIISYIYNSWRKSKRRTSSQNE